MVSPKSAAVDQKPGNDSTELGCAAVVVCRSVLIVANTMSPISSLLFVRLSRSPVRAPSCANENYWLDAVVLCHGERSKKQGQIPDMMVQNRITRPDGGPCLEFFVGQQLSWQEMVHAYQQKKLFLRDKAS